MGITAENVARAYGISREDQDAFAARQPPARRRPPRPPGVRRRDRPGGGRAGHDRGTASRAATGVTGRRATRARAPTPRSRRWRKLKPAFKVDGTVTAGNTSQMTDGAAAVVVMSRANAERLGLSAAGALRRLRRRRRGARRSWASARWRPIPKALQAGRPEPRRHRPDRAQRGLRRPGPGGHRASSASTRRQVNVNGGAIALGHPLGCTGAKLTASSSTSWSAAASATAWSPCASAAAWARPGSSSAPERVGPRGKPISSPAGGGW